MVDMTLDNDIGKLEAELKSNRPPLNALNIDLKNYLGHSELQLEYEDTGYRLKRDGRYAKDLSEGEKRHLHFYSFSRVCQIQALISKRG